ncbi:tRNA pseudouridine32 synthase / 23S rRNA pseudouridine746 synthase [Thiothrix eikelboomii]|uniref:Dual-specificity RNA pseudouridine synthase RluA n=1 Tax=Thiothrix eikelboomii TaxID=92487 RepID=A0A1T4XLR6_9GAMM|nr:RluA family pseudouridine synthase [Thiothrix eikelboomii]SKA90323.1 tRNA pseudouridine32 synthase / 23S rRNA pseudouridine746 synthase [Thiothrix eikelboomii]
MIYRPPADTGLDLYYLDEYLLVVNKPAGLLSVPGRGEDKQDCLINRVMQAYPDALIVHRLDMDTSGLLLMARGKAMQSALSILFQQRTVHKRYLAVVGGQLKQEEGEINLPLLLDWPNRPKHKVDFEQGKPSLTRYRLLSYDANTDLSRVELEPFTGRSHQLRVHLMSLGHPIVGDELYAPAELKAKADRLLLHAWQLGFQHPVTQVDLKFECLPAF